ncbi:hypothetical protein PAXRUDRAFT_830970 [Paxillus rubicundulus Ve08.2h10]|uniref:Uncharacterized protein n=1 Tax=Paxillus rubicundulus Ve08.2h10 TaxID=930991 RepID=A0A0D0DXU0_9AGAM|nr:hypothetical protein PAXRUDRAFT_830970 [Paxillus rubicundulus Ve08.2h10]
MIVHHTYSGRGIRGISRTARVTHPSQKQQSRDPDWDITNSSLSYANNNLKSLPRGIDTVAASKS